MNPPSTTLELQVALSTQHALAHARNLPFTPDPTCLVCYPIVGSISVILTKTIAWLKRNYIPTIVGYNQNTVNDFGVAETKRLAVISSGRITEATRDIFTTY